MQNTSSIYTKVRSSSAEINFHLSKVRFGISEQNIIIQKAPIAVLYRRLNLFKLPCKYRK